MYFSSTINTEAGTGIQMIAEMLNEVVVYVENIYATLGARLHILPQPFCRSSAATTLVTLVPINSPCTAAHNT